MKAPVTSEQSCELCERSGPPDADGWHPSPHTAHGWYRCKLRTPQGEPALTPPQGLPGTREPVVTAPKGNAGESPAHIPSKHVANFAGDCVSTCPACSEVVKAQQRLRAALSLAGECLSRGYWKIGTELTQRANAAIIEALSGDSPSPVETTDVDKRLSDEYSRGWHDGFSSGEGSSRVAALQDLAYYNGAQQAAAMAHQSVRAMDKWIAGGCGKRRSQAKQALAGLPVEPTREPLANWNWQGLDVWEAGELRRPNTCMSDEDGEIPVVLLVDLQSLAHSQEASGERVVIPSRTSTKPPPCVWREGCWDADNCATLGHCKNEKRPEKASGLQPGDVLGTARMVYSGKLPPRKLDDEKVGCNNYRFSSGEYCANCGYHLREHENGTPEQT